MKINILICSFPLEFRLKVCLTSKCYSWTFVKQPIKMSTGGPGTQKFGLLHDCRLALPGHFGPRVRKGREKTGSKNTHPSSLFLENEDTARTYFILEREVCKVTLSSSKYSPLSCYICVMLCCAAPHKPITSHPHEPANQ